MGFGVEWIYQESLSEQGPKRIYFTLKAIYFQWGWETMYYMRMRGITNPEEMLITNEKVSKSKQTHAEPR